MKKLVLRWLEAITTVSFFLIVAWCMFAGFTAFTAVGLPVVAGVLVGFLVGLIIAVIATGIIYLLISIHDHLDRISRDAGSAA